MVYRLAPPYLTIPLARWFQLGIGGTPSNPHRFEHANRSQWKRGENEAGAITPQTQLFELPEPGCELGPQQGVIDGERCLLHFAQSEPGLSVHARAFSDRCKLLWRGC